MVACSEYMVTLVFFAPGVDNRRAQQAVTIPWPVAKELLLILTRRTRGHERSYGEIVLPPAAWEEMGVAPEDWAVPEREEF